jgi:hypothetical protein
MAADNLCFVTMRFSYLDDRYAHHLERVHSYLDAPSRPYSGASESKTPVLCSFNHLQTDPSYWEKISNASLQRIYERYTW